MLMALALLDSNEIKKEFDYVKSSCEDELQELFKPLFDYFNSFWMEKTKPEGFSVYGLTDRTDNATESYHRDWRSRIKTNSYISSFLGTYITGQNLGKKNRFHFILIIFVENMVISIFYSKK